MAAGVMTRLLFVVVLSCLLPRSETIDSEACELGTTGVSATCGVVSALFGFFGALICAGTAGAGCGAVFAGVAAWYGVCASVVGNVPCGGDDLEIILGILTDIQLDIDELKSSLEFGFFEASFQDDINTIQNAGERYQEWVIEMSRDSGGNFVSEYWIHRWIDTMESTYDVGDALIEIEDMIGGEAVGSADKPSIYKISREQGLCSESLYRFVLNLITEGTALEFIYLEMVGQTVPESLTTQLKERILLNERMYLKYCRLNLPIEAFRIKVSGRTHAHTTGNLRIGVRQGEQNECKSHAETFPDSDNGEEYIVTNTNLFGTCRDNYFQTLFNYAPLEIRILSDSGDDAYLDEAGIKIDGLWRNWKGYEERIDNDTGNRWRVVIPAVDPLSNAGFSATQSSTENGGWASLAIDGNTDGDWSSGSCSKTRHAPNEWWRVDLDDYYKVFTVVIYNRQDTLQQRIDGAVVTAMDDEFPVMCGEVEWDSDADVYAVQCDMAATNFIKISKAPTSPLTLCEVEIYGEIVGMQKVETSGLAVSESSTQLGDPGRAIDGNRSGRWQDGSCTHTWGRDSSWWKINLGGPWIVHKVIVYNRMDCCEEKIDGAKVYAVHSNSMTECGEIDLQSGKKSYMVRCGDGILANQVKIAKSGVITLCEVEIYSTPTTYPPGSWTRYPDKYLDPYPSDQEMLFTTLKEAQDVCMRRNDCGGVTFGQNRNKFIICGGSVLNYDGSGRVSWKYIEA